MKTISSLLLLIGITIGSILFGAGYYKVLVEYYNAKTGFSDNQAIKTLLEVNGNFVEEYCTEHHIMDSDNLEYTIYSDVELLSGQARLIDKRYRQSEVLQNMRVTDPEKVKEKSFVNGAVYLDNYMMFKVLDNDTTYPVAYYRFCPQTGSIYFRYDGTYIIEVKGGNRYDVKTGRGITTNQSLIKANVKY